MAASVAEELDIDADKVRTTVFGVGEDGRLYLLEALTWNMDHQPEMTISMAAGQGSTGRCLATGAPNIAVRRTTGAGWGADVLPASEMAKLHPDLSWIVSLPVVVGGEDAKPVWILNVDGLAPVEQRRVEVIAPTLLYWAEDLSLILRTKLKEDHT
jgi:hypothetical protein